MASDTRVIGKTWRYVNKRGGPDRRFKDNRELPVVLYGEIDFGSGSGVQERIQVSNPEAGKPLAESIRALAAALVERTAAAN